MPTAATSRSVVSLRLSDSPAVDCQTPQRGVVTAKVFFSGASGTCRNQTAPTIQLLISNKINPTRQPRRTERCLPHRPSSIVRVLTTPDPPPLPKRPPASGQPCRVDADGDQVGDGQGVQQRIGH